MLRSGTGGSAAARAGVSDTITSDAATAAVAQPGRARDVSQGGEVVSDQQQRHSEIKEGEADRRPALDEIEWPAGKRTAITTVDGSTRWGPHFKSR